MLALTYQPRTLIENPSRATWWVIGIATATVIGAVVFFKTRKAAAATAGAKAFSASGDCNTITVVDESAARAAAAAAAIAVHPSPGDSALEAAKAALRIVVPSCDWSTPPPGRRFVFGSESTTWSQIESMLAGKTVAEITQLVGGYDDAQAPSFIIWLLSLPPGEIFG